MNDDSLDPYHDSERAKTERTVNKVWMILLPVFALLAMYQFYNWTQGRDHLRTLLSPVGFIFIGLSILLRPRNPALANILIAAALILVIAQVILMFVYQISADIQRSKVPSASADKQTDK